MVGAPGGRTADRRAARISTYSGSAQSTPPSRRNTLHGFALNCNPDLTWFDRIVPCGIRDATVTTLSAESGRHVTVTDAVDVAERHLADVLGASRWRSVTGTDPERLTVAVS